MKITNKNRAEYISHMGDDLLVVNAARVSFDKVKTEFDSRDNKLLKYLAKHNHWTPFAHPQICIRESVPIFVARQRFKHTIGFTYNEVSRRYVYNEPELYFPSMWRDAPSNGAKQGSDNVANEYMSEYNSQSIIKDCSHMVEKYQEMINEGVAPEQARMILPQNMMTEYFVTGSLYAWANMYKLRIDSHAQKEIQDLAILIDKIIKPLFPVSWELLTNEI